MARAGLIDEFFRIDARIESRVGRRFAVADLLSVRLVCLEIVAVHFVEEYYREFLELSVVFSWNASGVLEQRLEDRVVALLILTRLNAALRGVRACRPDCFVMNAV